MTSRLPGELPALLETRHRGLRFVRAEAEVDYRHWRRRTVAPFVRLAIAASFMNWAVFLLLGAWIFPHGYAEALAFGSALLLLLAGFGALTYLPAVQRALVPSTVVVNMIVGSTGAWVSYQTLGYPTETGITTAATLTATFFAFTVYRLPPVWATLSYLPYGALTVAFLVNDRRNHGLATDLFFGNLAFLGLAFLTGILACCLIEYLDRRSFRGERLIREQQDHLEQSNILIRRYVPPAVAERITAGDSAAVDVPHRRRVTILFSDIVGFTDIADRVDPETLTQVVGEYMASMAGIVEAHQGTLNEFAGDGLMALFGAPVELAVQDQALAAVRAAHAMQAALPGLNAAWRKLGLGADLRIRIGINTGMASVGSYGSAGRMTYTAIGLQTNIAARIQAHCEPGGVLISDATWQLVSDQVQAAPAGEVACKGVHFPVSVHTPSA